MRATATRKEGNGRPSLSALDRIRVGSLGLSTRKLRAGLSAVGIAIGIAALVGVLGISESARADLVAQLDQLGTNLLTVKPGQTLLGEQATLPVGAPEMVRRMPTVSASSAAYRIAGAAVQRTDLIPATDTGGLSMVATELNLLDTLGGSVREGRWLNAATEQLPAVVLGATAARRLGIENLSEPAMVWVNGAWFSIAGILEPLVLAPDLDEAAFVGLTMAQSMSDEELHATTIFVRAAEGEVSSTRAVLGATANPENPEETQVSRPSDALTAQVAAEGAFTSLFLGLGAVALLVGGVGIANVMVISVLERRREIGLRRALGATRFDVASQFLVEALLLSGLGGAIGAVIGAALVASYSVSQGWTIVIPPVALVLGVGAALVIGAAAGLYPSVTAARLAPTEALRTA